MDDPVSHAGPDDGAASDSSTDTNVAMLQGADASGLKKNGATNSGEKNRAAWPVREADLPLQLGVGRDMIRAVRQSELTRGVDWQQIHRDVMLTHRGLERLKVKLGLLQGAQPPPVAGETGSVEEPPPVPVIAVPAPVELVVVKADFLNKRVITARRPEHPARPEHVVTVMVKASNLFRPGLKILARQVAPHKFEFSGHYPKKPVGVTLADAAAAQLKGGA